MVGEHPVVAARLDRPAAWRRVIRRTLRRVRTRLSDSPVFLPVVLRLTPRGTTRRLDSSTELVVEGFPRSSNTFAVGALLVASAGGFRVVGHVHAPSQIVLAVRRSIPTLVVIRDPKATIRSLIVAAPHVRPRQAIREWVHFYEAVWDLREHFVIATFDQVTTDMVAVAQRLEARFGIDVPRFTHSADELARLEAHMAADHQRWHPDDVRSAPWPSAERAADSTAVGALLDDPQFDDLWVAAEAWYRRYESAGG